MRFSMLSLSCITYILWAWLALASGPIWEVGDTKCMPNFRNNVPVGYVCVKVEPGSIYAKTGLQKGDNVTEINGQSLATAKIEEAIDLWNEFEKAVNATLLVERGEKVVTLKKISQHALRSTGR